MSSSDSDALFVLEASHALERLQLLIDHVSMSTAARQLADEWLADLRFGLLVQRRAAQLSEPREAA